MEFEKNKLLEKIVFNYLKAGDLYDKMPDDIVWKEGDEWVNASEDTTSKLYYNIADKEIKIEHISFNSDVDSDYGNKVRLTFEDGKTIEFYVDISNGIRINKFYLTNYN